MFKCVVWNFVLVQPVIAVMVSVADEKLLVISEFLLVFCC